MAKRILVAVIFVPLLIVIMLFLPPVVMALTVSLIASIACHELLGAAGEQKVTLPMRAVSIASAAVIPLGAWLGAPAAVMGVCTFVVAAVSFWCAIRAFDGAEAPVGFYHVLLSIFGGALIPAGLSSLVILKCMEQGRYLVMLAVMLAFITDAGAYFAGVFLGKHRNITRVSPHKSVEGFAGGLLTGLLSALVYGIAVQRITGTQASLPVLALCGLLGAVATEVGDLSFSLIKRQYDIKDYGNLLPGHGGMLDRFDSMIFCAPVVMGVVSLFPVFSA